MSTKIYASQDWVKNIISESVFSQNGSGGSDGFSPTATVTQTDSGAVISITDKDGTTTATVTNGKDGNPGKDGENYILTEVDKQEIAEQAAELVDVPTDEHINSLINTALGVIENGTY